MDRRLIVQIKDKIATLVNDIGIVCRNSGYEIEFQFDEAWDAYDLKTAIFMVNGDEVRRVFAGNVCPVPEIWEAAFIKVGVTAGSVEGVNLSTTTPAFVNCVACAGGGNEAPLPEDDVYTQIVRLCEEARKGPVVGVDYFTEADKAEMVDSVIAELPVYGGEVETA